MEHLHFFNSDINELNLLETSYDPVLVVMSYLAASLAGFCASSIYQYIIIQGEQRKSPFLTLFSGIILGLGIWSMHFTAMLAFNLPVEVKYDLTITLQSILPAILASAITIYAIQQSMSSKLSNILASGILAIGIATMHFIGMEAMVMNAHMTHNLTYFILAILTSWVLAYFTILALKNDLKLGSFKPSPMIYSIITSLYFGFSVATMHYLAMASTFFIASDVERNLEGISIGFLSVAAVIGVLILVMGLAIILSFKKKIYVLDSLANTHQTYMAETIDNMTDPFILTDSKGKVLLLNHSFLENFSELSFSTENGVSILDIYNCFLNHYIEFDSDEERALLIEQFKQRQACKFKSVNGSWWLFRQTLTDTKNRILTWTNITEQTQQQNELMQAKDREFGALQELQETQNELSEAKRLNALAKVVANIAHELNTPIGVAITSLSGLQGNIQDIEKLIQSQQLTKAALNALISGISDYEDLANRNMHRAAGIVQQFKYISIDNYSIELQKVNLNGLISSVLATFQNELKQLNINASVNIKNDLTITTFEDAVNQVIQLLIRNVIQHAFSDEQNHQLDIYAYNSENEVTIEVSDTGCGIDNSIKDNLFEPFVSTKRFEGSLGLGLHIVYNIVNYKLKGKIRVNSEHMAGSTFIISLPNVL